MVHDILPDISSAEKFVFEKKKRQQLMKQPNIIKVS